MFGALLISWASCLIIHDPNKDGLGRMNITTLSLPPTINATSAPICSPAQFFSPMDFHLISTIPLTTILLSWMMTAAASARSSPASSYNIPKRTGSVSCLFATTPECRPTLDDCKSAEVIRVDFPWDIESDNHTINHWSEVIITPDNVHIAWTMLGTDIGSAHGLGSLHRSSTRYSIEKAQVISTIDTTYLALSTVEK
jgi:hypothetical protein